MCGSELHHLPEGVQRVAAFLQQAGHGEGPRMLDGAARTAQEAADQLGILVGQGGAAQVVADELASVNQLVQVDTGLYAHALQHVDHVLGGHIARGSLGVGAAAPTLQHFAIDDVSGHFHDTYGPGAISPS